MMKLTYPATAAFALLLVSLPAAFASADVNEIVAQFPAPDAATASQLFDALLDEGEPAVQVLCDQLVPLGGGDDNGPRYALTGLARYVSTGETRKEQDLVEEALLEALEEEEDAEVKTFLLRQLQQCGTNDTASEIGDLLLDEAVASHAILALDAIGTSKAKKVMTKALKSTTGLTQLRLLSALADNGRNRTAVGIVESRLEAMPDANEYVQLLSLAVAFKGDKAHEDLIAAMDREEPRCRKAAFSHAAPMMDKYAVRKWRAKINDDETPDEAKREIGTLLAAFEANE